MAIGIGKVAGDVAPVASLDRAYKLRPAGKGVGQLQLNIFYH